MSEIDRYLDEMFDRLAGTGGAGRRALAETEDHLRAAVDEGSAEGLSRTEAEHRAVTRFGSPARIAGELRRAQLGATLRTALSGGWLLAGLAPVLAGTAYLIKAAGIAVLLWIHPEDAPPCGPVRGGGVGEICSQSVPIMRSVTVAGLVLATLGLIMLLGRRAAVRSGRLTPASRRFPGYAAALLVLAGLVLFVSPGGGRFAPDGLTGIQRGPGVDVAFIASLVAAGLAVVVAVWGVVRARRPRYSA